MHTYSIQSTATIKAMSSIGRPTEVSTITMVTKPALGTDAAPMAASVAVILKGNEGKTEIKILLSLEC